MHIFYKALKYLAFTFLAIVALLFVIAEFAEDQIADIWTCYRQTDNSLTAYSKVPSKEVLFLRIVIFLKPTCV